MPFVSFFSFILFFFWIMGKIMHYVGIGHWTLELELIDMSDDWRQHGVQFLVVDMMHCMIPSDKEEDNDIEYLTACLGFGVYGF